MELKSIHIALTNLDFESRIFKQANTISKIKNISSVILFGISSNSYKPIKFLNEKVKIYKHEKKFKFKPIEFIRYFLFIRKNLKKNDYLIFHFHSVKILIYLIPIKILFKNSKIVYDTHELETETMGLKGFKKIILKLIEKKLIYHADLSVFVNESIKNWYHKKYSFNLNSVVLYNSPSENWITQKKHNIFRKKKYVTNNKPIILYQGFFAKGRGIEKMIENIKNLKKNNFNFVFLGYGPLESLIVNTAKNNKYMIFIPSVDLSLLPIYTSSADFGLALIENKCLSYNLCLPNKFFEYSASALPIICSDLFEMRKLIDNYNSGFILKNNSLDEFELMLKKLNRIDYKVYSGNSLKMFKEFNWEKQAKNYISKLKEIINDFM
tara:strand:- start:2595 stop:3737 length:1143 start_codon:yes stop_codon:yes gene_type:complete